MRVIIGRTRPIYPIMVNHFPVRSYQTPSNGSLGDRFFKYNDETVTEVPETEVLQDRTGSDANPALLCYVRKGKNLVDTLHREVLEKAEEGAMPLIDLDG